MGENEVLCEVSECGTGRDVYAQHTYGKWIQMTVKVGIINVTSYSGSELVRLLHSHNGVSIECVTGRSAAGKRLSEVFPHLASVDMVIEPEVGESIDVAFSALPHKASAEVVIPLLDAGIKVVDISADFRLKDPNDYKTWYGGEHLAPHLLETAVYGLTEIHRREIGLASLVANPGCYPTGAILALAPAVKEGLIEADIVIDSKSGVSGAGRSLGLDYHFSEANDNLKAYSIDGHRHLPEISQELAMVAGSKVNVTFLPHLVPLTRGILSSCYALLNESMFPDVDKAKTKIVDAYREFYKDEQFVHVVNEPPQTKQTWGSNMCYIYPTVDVRTGRLIVVSCLDNLVKGAAGQAIQNMNVMCQMPESEGLESLAVYP